MSRSTPLSLRIPVTPNKDIDKLNTRSIAILVPKKSAILNIKIIEKV